MGNTEREHPAGLLRHGNFSSHTSVYNASEGNAFQHGFRRCEMTRRKALFIILGMSIALVFCWSRLAVVVTVRTS